MPLTDEQVKKDAELKNLEARRNNGEQLTDEENETLRKGQGVEDKSTERTNKGADAHQEAPKAGEVKEEKPEQRNPQGSNPKGR